MNLSSLQSGERLCCLVQLIFLLGSVLPVKQIGVFSTSSEDIISLNHLEDGLLESLSQRDPIQRLPPNFALNQDTLLLDTSLWNNQLIQVPALLSTGFMGKNTHNILLCNIASLIKCFPARGSLVIQFPFFRYPSHCSHNSKFKKMPMREIFPG